MTRPIPTDVLPRVRLAHLPTPIEHLPNLSRYLGGPEIYVKRDDLTGLATGGNKTRKLEFLMAQALEAGADAVITAGAIQSNHARQTAAAARKLGLEPHLVLGRPAGGPPAVAQGNLLINQLVGAIIHWTDEPAPYAETIEAVGEALQAEGRKPYVIPYGGSNAYGAMGYVTAMYEIAEQTAGMEPFSTHVFATSSGGMHAGMVLGAALAYEQPPRLIGISIADPAETIRAHIAGVIDEAARVLGVEPGLSEAGIVVNDDYLGGGYAAVGDLEREAIRLAARHEGLLVDPVYTGRALGGLIDLIRRGAFQPGERVLFWHTGGTAALSAFAEVLATG